MFNSLASDMVQTAKPVGEVGTNQHSRTTQQPSPMRISAISEVSGFHSIKTGRVRAKG